MCPICQNFSKPHVLLRTHLYKLKLRGSLCVSSLACYELSPRWGIFICWFVPRVPVCRGEILHSSQSRTVQLLIQPAVIYSRIRGWIREWHPLVSTIYYLLPMSLRNILSKEFFPLHHLQADFRCYLTRKITWKTLNFWGKKFGSVKFILLLLFHLVVQCTNTSYKEHLFDFNPNFEMVKFQTVTRLLYFGHVDQRKLCEAKTARINIGGVWHMHPHEFMYCIQAWTVHRSVLDQIRLWAPIFISAPISKHLKEGNV